MQSAVQILKLKSSQTTHHSVKFLHFQNHTSNVPDAVKGKVNPVLK
jgi:hypothetical protein